MENSLFMLLFGMGILFTFDPLSSVVEINDCFWIFCQGF